ncbi:MAG: hypothetical protein GTO14_15660 [Anaerolineales bacterium]|nr:hypothetical protein [Anaerolineales bacterium]
MTFTRRKVEVKGMNCSGLFVEDMESSIHFYGDVLGLELLDRDDGRAHFDAGNGRLLELLAGGGVPTRQNHLSNDP